MVSRIHLVHHSFKEDSYEPYTYHPNRICNTCRSMHDFLRKRSKHPHRHC